MTAFLISIHVGTVYWFVLSGSFRVFVCLECSFRFVLVRVFRGYLPPLSAKYPNPAAAKTNHEKHEKDTKGKEQLRLLRGLVL